MARRRPRSTDSSARVPTVKVEASVAVLCKWRPDLSFTVSAMCSSVPATRTVPQSPAWHYEAASQLNPKHAGVLAACGRLLAQLGRKDEARQRFTSALALQPGHAGASKGLDELDRAASTPAPTP